MYEKSDDLEKSDQSTDEASESMTLESPPEICLKVPPGIAPVRDGGRWRRWRVASFIIMALLLAALGLATYKCIEEQKANNQLKDRVGELRKKLKEARSKFEDEKRKAKYMKSSCETEKSNLNVEVEKEKKKTEKLGQENSSLKKKKDELKASLEQSEAKYSADKKKWDEKSGKLEEEKEELIEEVKIQKEVQDYLGNFIMKSEKETSDLLDKEITSKSTVILDRIADVFFLNMPDVTERAFLNAQNTALVMNKLVQSELQLEKYLQGDRICHLLNSLIMGKNEGRGFDQFYQEGVEVCLLKYGHLLLKLAASAGSQKNNIFPLFRVKFDSPFWSLPAPGTSPRPPTPVFVSYQKALDEVLTRKETEGVAPTGDLETFLKETNKETISLMKGITSWDISSCTDLLRLDLNPRLHKIALRYTHPSDDGEATSHSDER